MKATISLGRKITLEIDERDEMETLHKAIILSSPKLTATSAAKTLSHISLLIKIRKEMFISMPNALCAEQEVNLVATRWEDTFGTITKYVPNQTKTEESRPSKPTRKITMRVTKQTKRILAKRDRKIMSNTLLPMSLAGASTPSRISPAATIYRRPGVQIIHEVEKEFED